MAKAKLHVRKGDTVKVLSGKDRGATGEIIRALPSEGRVVVKGVALMKKSVRPTQVNPRGGIITKEAPIRSKFSSIPTEARPSFIASSSVSVLIWA